MHVAMRAYDQRAGMWRCELMHAYSFMFYMLINLENIAGHCTFMGIVKTCTLYMDLYATWLFSSQDLEMIARHCMFMVIVERCGHYVDSPRNINTNRQAQAYAHICTVVCPHSCPCAFDTWEEPSKDTCTHSKRCPCVYVYVGTNYIDAYTRICAACNTTGVRGSSKEASPTLWTASV